MIDDYYGTEVSDPYRYMENLQDPAVQSWFVLAGIPGRGKLLARIVELGESTSADVGDSSEIHGQPTSADQRSISERN